LLLDAAAPPERPSFIFLNIELTIVTLCVEFSFAT